MGTSIITDPNAKIYLKQLENSQIQSELWDKLKKTPAQLFLWKKGQEDPTEMGWNNKLTTKAYNQKLYLDVQAALWQIFLSDYQKKLVFFKWKWTEEQQIFSSGEMNFDESYKALYVTLSYPFFLTTKRYTCRYLATQTDQIFLQFGTLYLRAFDVSSGGFSADVNAADLALLANGQTLEKCELKYNLKKFSIPKVKVLKIHEPTIERKLYRVAFKFEGLKAAEEDAIWLEVNQSIKRLAHLLGY